MPKTHPIKILPSQDYLRERFDYNPETGALTWKMRPREHFAITRLWRTWNSRFVGKLAGSLRNDGYRMVRLDGTFYLAHRIIWKLMTGEEPPDDPDHINCDPSDNRWKNLRPATRPQQRYNARLNKNNTSGFRGVTQRLNGRYRARIWIKGVCRDFGHFATAKEAAAAYETAARELHGDFYH